MKPVDLMSVSISEFVTGVDAFSPTDRVSEVIGYMKENQWYEALVEDGDRTSIVTVRDLLDLTSLETRLSKLMHQVPRLNRQNTVSDAASLMFEYRTRSMPIYDGDKLVGQATSPLILGRMFDSEVPVRLSSVMTKEPNTIQSDSTVASARELMRRKKIDQVPIIDQGRLSGVITSDSIVFNMVPRTDRDVKGGNRGGRFAEPLREYGTGSIVTNEVTDSLLDVYVKMKEEQSNYSMIVNTGELQGIVTYRDFMKVLLRRSAPAQLPVYIVGLPDDPFSAAAVRQKFTEAIRTLRKGFPEMSEARAVIKSAEAGGPKQKSQVDVFIASPKERYSYSVFSYEVADAFDQVNAWAKKLNSQRKKARLKTREKRRLHAVEFPEE